ncbi:MAG: DNA gyrase subunit A, partial [Christensenellaceae bacterium]|nr:DNA gyrase subunit A [Christensenellaceae bacterium]
GDEVIDAGRMKEDHSVLIISENGFGKRTPVEDYRPQTRGGIGIKTMNVTEKTGYVCGMKIVAGDEDFMLISDANSVIRMDTAEIPSIGRTTQGVRVMRLDDDSRVVTLALLPKEEDAPEEASEETTEE